jgi:ATP-binding cassette subfamily F protein 3
VQHGVRALGHNVRTGYFSQNRIDVLDPKHTVLESALDAPNPVSEQTARTVLGSFLFRGDDVFKSVAVLSGGEKSRLALVKLLLDPPNLLLMDEPTTHLDVGSIDALIGALKQYHGTLIFISHDVHFIRAIATIVLHVAVAGSGDPGRPARTGQLTFYPGDYDYYLDKSKATSARTALTAGSNGQKSEVGKQTAPGLREQKAQKRLEAETRNAVAKARREKEKRLHELEMKIAALEGQQKDLAAALEDPTAYEQGGRAIAINRALSSLAEDLARLTAEWENATALVAPACSRRLSE